jgi:hypothetical protein
VPSTGPMDKRLLFFYLQICTKMTALSFYQLQDSIYRSLTSPQQYQIFQLTARHYSLCYLNVVVPLCPPIFLASSCHLLILGLEDGIHLCSTTIFHSEFVCYCIFHGYGTTDTRHGEGSGVSDICTCVSVRL